MLCHSEYTRIVHTPCLRNRKAGDFIFIRAERAYPAVVLYVKNGIADKVVSTLSCYCCRSFAEGVCQLFAIRRAECAVLTYNIFAHTALCVGNYDDRVVGSLSYSLYRILVKGNKFLIFTPLHPNDTDSTLLNALYDIVELIRLNSLVNEGRMYNSELLLRSKLFEF